ncbi:hypothetical protein ACFWY9_01110 [Amycolatopsis sp. NPDC059027]|uniref:hypothetical protein n=1 Tax=Amycolatopsis sp. NPDC059027 TaxID=3346709 RepID=UPI00366EAB69
MKTPAAAAVTFTLAVVVVLSACSNSGGTSRGTNQAVAGPSPPPTAQAAPSKTPAPTTSATPNYKTNALTGHILKQVGENLTIMPNSQTNDGPGATKIVVNKITRGKPAYDGSQTVRVAMSISTGNDQETNEQASMFACGVMSSADPDTGEQRSGRGGMMVSDRMPTVLGRNKSYQCTFDAEGLHDHGFLILGNGGSPLVDYPYDVR